MPEPEPAHEPEIEPEPEPESDEDSWRAPGAGAGPEPLLALNHANDGVDERASETSQPFGPNHEPEAERGCDKDWQGMRADEQQACSTLGWTQQSWDHPNTPDPLFDRDWSELSAHQQHCAELLCIDPSEFKKTKQAQLEPEAEPDSNVSSEEMVAIIRARQAAAKKSGAASVTVSPTKKRAEKLAKVRARSNSAARDDVKSEPAPDLKPALEPRFAPEPEPEEPQPQPQPEHSAAGSVTVAVSTASAPSEGELEKLRLQVSAV